MGQTMEKYIVYVNEEMECVFFLGFIILYFLFFTLFYVYSMVVFRNSNSLGCYCKHRRGTPQSLYCWSSSNVLKRMGEGQMDHGRGMVEEVKSVLNLVCGGSGGVDGSDGSGVFRSAGGGLFRSALFYGTR